VISLVFGRDHEVAAWVAQRIGLDAGFGPCAAIGVAVNGDVAAGVVYSHYIEHRGRPILLDMSVAASRRDWLSRPILRALFDYPFNQIGVARVQSLMAADNHGAIDFNLRLGFTQEAVLRKAYFDGRDAVLTAMLKEDCTWIKGVKYG
jgi:RimJ/RimL family protein N-acetyltransferase